MNSSYSFHKTNSDQVLFTTAKDKIEVEIINYLNKFSDEEISAKPLNEIKIKLSSDGTNCGKNLFLVNFVFTILNETRCKSKKGNYTLGIGEIEEKYGVLQEPFGYLMDQINSLNCIVYKDNLYSISFYFGADLKFLLEINGLYSAKSNYPCLWCKCSKDELYKLGYSSFNTDMSRSNVECKQIIEKKSKNHLGYKYISLLSGISFNKCVPDTLHTRLRIPGNLIKLLIRKLAIMDSYDGKDVIHFNKHINLTIWYHFLKNDCKIKLKLIPFNLQNTAGITKDLNGKQILKVFKKINIVKLFPELDKKEIIHKIWKDYYLIDRHISKNLFTPQKLEEKTRDWLSNFLNVYTSDQVTPYTHVLTNHFHEFLKEFGNISIFTEQGNDKFIYNLII